MALKEKVLQILEKCRPQSVSGQELAVELGVSRAAVWKAVGALKRDGHQVEAATNRGYRLREDSDILTAEGIMSVARCVSGAKVYSSLESTNTTAKLAAIEGASDGTVIVALEQTGGKGRRGRAFFSPMGGTYFSVVLRPKITAGDSVLVTTAAAVATARTIEELTSKPAAIKWINDVYIDNKKCVGILTEAIIGSESGSLESVVVGIGVNTGDMSFPEAIAQSATSIGNVSRNSLIAGIADKLIEYSSVLPENGHLEEYRKRCFLLGKIVTVTGKDGAFRARAIAVDERGRLLVERGGEEIALSTEEVSVRPIAEEE